MTDTTVRDAIAAVLDPVPFGAIPHPFPGTPSQQAWRRKQARGKADAVLAALPAILAAEYDHTLTEYGTTQCPKEGVRANADDEGGVLVCSACGGQVAPPWPAVADAELRATLARVRALLDAANQRAMLRTGDPSVSARDLRAAMGAHR